METFLGMEVEQPCKVIKLHLDNYIQEVLKDYKECIKNHFDRSVIRCPLD
jgi:hypothetical protein